MRRLQFSTGHSDDPDACDAVREALAQARAGLDVAVKAALVFVGIEYDQDEIGAELAELLPGVPHVGCSTDGELSDRAFSHEGVVLFLMGGDAIEKVRVGVGMRLSEDPEAAVVEALAQAGLEAPTLVLTAPSSLRTNLDAAMRGLRERLPGVPIAGGASGDAQEAERGREFVNGEVYEDSLPVLMIQGTFEVSMGVASGWVPIGADWVATRTEGNQLLELNGRPALQVLHAWLGTLRRAVTLEFPLAVFPQGVDGPFYMRAVLEADPETGALTLPAEVPQGSSIRLTQASNEQVLAGAEASLQSALAGLSGPPDGLLVFSCAGRRWLLGTQAPQEQATLSAVSSAPMAGFYGFAELGPLGDLGVSVHNQTCVTVGLRAR